MFRIETSLRNKIIRKFGYEMVKRLEANNGKEYKRIKERTRISSTDRVIIGTYKYEGCWQ